KRSHELAIAVDRFRSKPERQRGEEMRKNLLGFSGLAMIVILALASTVVAAKPAVAANRITVEIPFEFSVGYKTMPAGEYSVQELQNSNSVLIQSRDGKTSAVRLSNAIEASKLQSHARRVFHRYGARYFLAQCWNGLDKNGRE